MNMYESMGRMVTSLLEELPGCNVELRQRGSKFWIWVQDKSGRSAMVAIHIDEMKNPGIWEIKRRQFIESFKQ